MKKNNVFLALFALLFALLVSFVVSPLPESAYTGSPVSHEVFDGLLKKHVDSKGNVDYKGFIQDSSLFNAYLDMLSTNPPDAKTWTKNAQKAYWINVYNAFTLKIVMNHYPVKSIKDIKNGLPFINSTWDIKFIKIGTVKYDLNNIEHSILRPRFKDSRVHFAINCASYSCPKLRNEAYIAEQLDAQLDAQARDFLADNTKNIIKTNEIRLSEIFKWYASDFPTDLIGYLNKYAPTRISSKAKKSYMNYNWNLNEK